MVAAQLGFERRTHRASPGPIFSVDIDTVRRQDRPSVEGEADLLDKESSAKK
jgi:hypothetical protein